MGPYLKQRRMSTSAIFTKNAVLKILGHRRVFLQSFRLLDLSRCKNSVEANLPSSLPSWNSMCQSSLPSLERHRWEFITFSIFFLPIRDREFISFQFQKTNFTICSLFYIESYLGFACSLKFIKIQNKPNSWSIQIFHPHYPTSWLYFKHKRKFSVKTADNAFHLKFTATY